MQYSLMFRYELDGVLGIGYWVLGMGHWALGIEYWEVSIWH
ncbi:hypothetical protein [Nostoc sp.]